MGKLASNSDFADLLFDTCPLERLNGFSDGITPYTVRLDGGSMSFRGRLPTNCIFAAGPIDPSEPEHHISFTPVPIVDSVVIQTDVPEGSKIWDDSMIFWHFETKTEGFWSIKQCLHPSRRAGSCRVSEGNGTAITYNFDGADPHWRQRVFVQLNEKLYRSFDYYLGRG